jgi:hypothetical protein
MTANIEERGLDTGFEMGVRLKGSDAKNLREILLNWTTNFPQTLVLDGRIGELGNKVKLWRNGELVEMEIGDKYEKNLGEIEAPSIDEMKTAKPRDFPTPASPNMLFRQHVYTWTVVPPRLPKKAKPEKKKHPLPVHRLGKDTYVTIHWKNQLGQARKLAKEIGARIVVSEPPKESKKSTKT